MRSLLLRFSFITLISLLSTSSVIGSLYIREPHSRLYYTLYIPNGNSDAAKSVAHQLDARYEGPIGELHQYHEISTPKPPLLRRSLDEQYNQQLDEYSDTHGDIIKRFESLKQGQQQPFVRRDNSNNVAYHLISQVDSLKPQIKKRRLVKRAPSSQYYTKKGKRQEPGEYSDMDDTTGSSDENDTNDSVNDGEQDGVDDPVIENAPQEHSLDVISSQAFLNLPDGFQSLKQTLAIEDPGFDQQWHLVNQVQRGHDVNITGVWSQGITGKNIVVAILDDGLDMDNDDLKDNFFADGSYDFNDHTDLPKPRLSDDTHGTRCAGEIAAVKNGVCGVGMAYDAKVAGIRILSAEITDEDEARALNYKYQENHIYSCSWGPPDYGEVAEAPQGIVLDAIKNGINNGRNGTGTIYVFASGNGGGNDDNCNFDGYTNSIYTITVGAIDRMGNHPYYSERCSAQLVVTYSSGSGGNIYTTDIGQNQCTDRHGGTSAAAPLAAGVFALVLSIRPDLTWRDMQYLCVQTAVPLSLEDTDWTLLPSGRMYNHKFGYGKLDAYAIVEAAKTFEKVGPQTYLQVSSPENKRTIPDRTLEFNDLTDTISVTQDMVDAAGLARLEHITVMVYIEHDRRGDLEVLLESPQNISSQLGAPRKYDVSAEGLINWTFMTVKHWDEDPVGDWTLRVIDWKRSQFTGSFTNWTITLWGEVMEEMEGDIIHIPTTETISSHQTPDWDSIILDASISQGTTPPISSISQMPSTTDEPFIEHSAAVTITASSSSSPSSTVTSIQESTSTISTSTTITTTAQEDQDSIDQEPDYRGLVNEQTDSEPSEWPKKENISSSGYYFFVLTVGIVAAGLSWILRRRIRGPGSAKDITAYTNLSQHQRNQHESAYVYEFDHLNQGRRLQQHLSEDEEEGGGHESKPMDNSGNKTNKDGARPCVAPMIDSMNSGRQSNHPMVKRQSPPNYGKGK
ncbi:peptidase S8/S53 domain-containing protein [Absidia repens]|uniref:Peptidase S8/S53 domain-containing protein n=1 Tax=Absidia repens TaxID=90262 RepID=A0A1X2IND4_9FUNG|nr:peptidase S8/S53 domain-containing protein [Absidia repens]